MCTCEGMCVRVRVRECVYKCMCACVCEGRCARGKVWGRFETASAELNPASVTGRPTHCVHTAQATTGQIHPMHKHTHTHRAH